MSHTIQPQSTPFGAPTFIQISIQDYTNGGESVTNSEWLAGSGPKGIFFFPVLSSTLAQVVFATWTPINAFTGRIRIFQISAGVIAEIPTTVGLNLLLSGYGQFF